MIKNNNEIDFNATMEIAGAGPAGLAASITLAAPFVVFVPLYFFPWNPMHPSIVAMIIGVVATTLCRPDLKCKSWIGGHLFLGYYAIFLAGLEWSTPGYIGRVWNLEALSDLSIGFMPIEEPLFAVFFGMYWSSVYEHFTRRKIRCICLS